MKHPYQILITTSAGILVAFSLTHCKPKQSAVSAHDPVIITEADIGKVIQEDEYFSKDYFRYDDHIYSSSIKTVLFHRAGWELSYPMIEYGSQEKLLLSFDDIDGEIKNYHYTIIHCNADWKPSDILPSEYLEGFTEDYINDFIPSFNTLQRYMHYWLEIPSEVMQPKLSGNYLLVIYPEGRRDQPLITRRFMIFEKRIAISANIFGATLLEDRKYKQEVDFEINTSGYRIDDVYTNFKVIVMQNGRWDNAIYDLQPLMIRGENLDYNHDFGNVFNGGNEFRYFDIKSFKYNSERVLRYIFSEKGMECSLRPDAKRSFKVYTQQTDLNGMFFIKTEDGADSRTEGDYVWVHFSLPMEIPQVNGNFYVYGGLTYWQLADDGKMIYDYSKSAYTASLYLKQGYYNYQYVFLEDGTNTADETFIEGNHFETENEYTILAYNRERGSRYDRLIGVSQFNSLGRKE